MYKLSARSLRRLEGIDPVLLDIIKEGIKDSPFDFGIPQDGGLRTTRRQKELFAIGRTEPGKKVTNADGVIKPSYHQTGKAFDIYAFVDGKASWDVNHIRAIAEHLIAVAASKGVKLTWGGSWAWKDWVHFQID